MPQPRVTIIGGGLAGLAAAARLLSAGIAVELFESCRLLGGRAGSFFDTESGEWLDHCQHVALGCCSEYLEFCRLTGVLDHFRADDTLYFLDRQGQRTRFRGSRWLPAPLHLAPALLRLKFLPLTDRLRIARTLRKLQYASAVDAADGPTIGAWLRQQGETELALARFWSVVLVSALSETLERISVPAARQVFVEGFMTHRAGYHVWRPTKSLRRLYENIADWIVGRGGQIHTGTPIKRLHISGNAATEFELPDGTRRPFDAGIVAVPWRRIGGLFDAALAERLPQVSAVADLATAPIAAVHLWFDQPITDLPHAVLLDRLSQWLFSKPDATANNSQTGHYYQVVISAAQELTNRSREDVLAEVLADVREVFPAARTAELLRSRVLVEAHAVFSPLPGVSALRPRPETELANLFLAGDWTASGWPSTMEGAVRSGNRAAAALLKQGHTI